LEQCRSGIYQIRNLTNGNIYVGSSTNINRRWREHRHDLNLNKHNNHHLQYAWNKYGKNYFVFEIIELIDNKNILVEREQFYIDSWNPQYNIAPTAGNMLGFTHSEESKKKMSESRKGFQVGEKNPNYGKPMSKEQKIQISKSLMGRFIGIKNPMYGKHLSKECKTHLSETKKGNHYSKITEFPPKQVICIETGIIYESISEAGRQTGLDFRNIHGVCKGRCKTTGGFHWKYYIEEGVDNDE